MNSSDFLRADWNSEVGHTNIGAGNVVLQDLPRINRSISTGEFYNNKVLLEAMENSASGHTLHIMGLCSDGGVHSKLEHLYAVLELAKRSGIKDVVVHCFLDGRDVPPRSAMTYLSALEEKFSELGLGRIGVISGRFYAMDRDKRWERLELAYDALTTFLKGSRQLLLLKRFRYHMTRTSLTNSCSQQSSMKHQSKTVTRLYSSTTDLTVHAR